MIECQCFVCRQARDLDLPRGFIKEHPPEPPPMWRDVSGGAHRVYVDDGNVGVAGAAARDWAMLRLPTDSAERKRIPLGTGLIDYFPDALAEVAKVSQFGNDKHNPGEPLHHARGKSMDHEDCVMRHYVDRYGVDPASGLDEAAFMCWRALAFYQELLERRNDLPLPRGARPA